MKCPLCGSRVELMMKKVDTTSTLHYYICTCGSSMYEFTKLQFTEDVYVSKLIKLRLLGITS